MQRDRIVVDILASAHEQLDAIRRFDLASLSLATSRRQQLLEHLETLDDGPVNKKTIHPVLKELEKIDARLMRLLTTTHRILGAVRGDSTTYGLNGRLRVARL